MTIETNAKNYRDSVEPLDLDDVLARFPALRASHGMPGKVSAKYQHISTENRLRHFAEEGFNVHGVMVDRTRNEAKQSFVRHCVTLRKPGLEFSIDGLSPQITWIGSHDGSTADYIIGGAFRAVCFNGLTVGAASVFYRVPHFGRNVTDKVIDAAYSVVANIGTIGETFERMQSVTLDADQRDAFASEALALRYKPEHSPFTAAQLLTARRDEDLANDVFTVYNRVQENLMQGGLGARIVGADGRARNTTMRGLRAIGARAKLNAGLFDIANRFALAA